MGKSLLLIVRREMIRSGNNLASVRRCADGTLRFFMYFQVLL
ncbi:MAG: hypothetical protein AAF773_05875 [Cyanobacteria bacterium P01_D01_bin.115]